MKACPRCGGPQPAPPERPVEEGRCDLARLDSIAEAGYLVSLLEEAGVPASVRPLEAFDAVRGGWSSSYGVSVAASDREAAARVLTAESHDDFVRVSEQVFDRAEPAGAAQRVNPWRMLTVLAVVTAAGVVAIDTLGHPLRRARRAPAPRQRATPPEPLDALVQSLEPNHNQPNQRVTMRLSYSPETEVLVLATDADGDGRYETQRHFAARPIDPPPADR